MTFSRYFLCLALIGTFAVHPGWSQGTSTLSGNVTDTTDQYIRDNTWTSIACAALVGCIIGYLLAGRGD